MKLPNLPKINKMLESKSALRFRTWWLLHGKNAPYETKDTRSTDSFPFSELSAEQEAFAVACGTEKGVLIRVEKGTIGSPDYVGFRNTVAYIVIHFKSGTEVITINNFIRCRDTCGRKSLAYNLAKSVSSKSFK